MKKMGDLLLDIIRVNGFTHYWRRFKVQTARPHDNDNQGHSSYENELVSWDFFFLRQV